LSHIKVNKVFSFMSNIRTEVSTNNAMPLKIINIFYKFCSEKIIYDVFYQVGYNKK